MIALSSPNPVDVISDDRHTVKPWFQGKLPFTFNLPELAGSNFTLIGGTLKRSSIATLVGSALSVIDGPKTSRHPSSTSSP